MYNSRNNTPFGRNNRFGSRYQYQELSSQYAGAAQASGLMSKVMGLLAFSFIFASVGAFVGISIGLGYGASEGLSLAPLRGYYLANATYILTEAFLMTAVTSLGLGVYAWTTKRDFSRLSDYLFFGLILLIVAGLIGIFFHSTIFSLIISIVGVAIFSGYVLFYVQRAKYMADTTPNAIGLTVSIFITVLNLFLYILELLTILSGNRRN
jgi:modulator of FtsH protease